MLLSGFEYFEALFSNSVDMSYETESVNDHAGCTFRKQNLDFELIYANAELLAK